MKKCKFCDHRALTDWGEEVCTKYLYYLGEQEEERPCEGFEVSLSWKPIAFLAVCLVVVVLMCSLL